ncbi:MAG: dihydrofolate reductase family protein [Nocardioidaceae bacterium]
MSSPTVGAQLLELELIDEISIYVAPILLGEGIRLYNNPGSEPIRLHRLDDVDPRSACRVRYRPTTTAKVPTEKNSLEAH